MEHLAWNKLLDRYLLENTMLSEEWEQLDDTQKIIINELKKSFARLNKKEVCKIHHSFTDK